MRIKKYSMILLTIITVMVPVLTSSCIFSGIFGSGDGSAIRVEKVEGRASGTLTEEEFENLLENEDFLETFDTFYYPGSTVKEAGALLDGQEMIYVILESGEFFNDVEEYYRNKKVQSIWSRDFIYQKSMAQLEEEFIETGEEDILISKFTFSSKDRDKMVDVLVKELAADRTQIMITFWNLQ